MKTSNTTARSARATVAAIVMALAPVSGSAQTVIPPADVSRPAGTQAHSGKAADLLASGVKRHDDTSLSPAGRSCNTCHREANSYNQTFVKPWPHFVQSVRTKTGLDRITAEGMVQFCMISAMGTRPLPWDSEALAALTEFVLERHRKVVTP